MGTHSTDGSSRPAAGTLVLTLSAILVVFGMAGCGSNNNAGPSSTSTTATGTEFGNTIRYGSVGTTTNLDCGDGKRLNVAGSNNTLTVKGTCETVSVGGADNKITIDKIDRRISVLGMNNTITFKDGTPKIENRGTGNTISKAS